MKLLTLACLTACAFSYSVIFGYAYFVMRLDGSPYPIPTISKTWTFKPSNFISRQVVISGSVCLVIIHLSIYYACKALPGADFLLFIALVANMSLAVVSAVCMDDHSAECLGSILLHDDFAVTYFALIDFWMVGMQSIVFPSLVSSKTPLRKHYLRNFLCLLSVSTKLRYVNRVPTILGVSLGEFEWVNVMSILMFMVTFVRDHVTTTQVGIMDLDAVSASTSKTFKPLLVVTNAALTAYALIMCIVTIGLAYLVTFSREDFQPLPHIPEVSDLFVLPPGNTLAHLGGVMGSTLLSIVVFQFYYAYKQWTSQPWIPLGLSLLAVFALSMSMCVSKIEDTALHFTFVSMFFSLFQLFSLWITFGIEQGKTLPGNASPWMIVCALVSLMTKTRFAVWDLEPFALYELCDIVSILVFIGAFAWFQEETLTNHPFGLFIIDDDNTTNDDVFAEKRKNHELVLSKEELLL